ncbi:ATP-dependent Lon protease [Geoalkalibacter ferrihydriticus]|uniref:ATP-dependent Lon protease n=2 Tax=Geoalkalibacter ferrihydriticus TaxID=392333 RepID=A0A0C2DS26_9BACT|nr:BREX system Lon protease-like protein BrxL [Geoalkalibacter ferrihydriticus]KIH76254.1 ATP-dependent Lon protease [Geoalkalibacter ferrihydriticus DSM 17813]SDL24250.1 ATP-dependent Lon protease [Geoalkalibacter ferrihydriticus]
MNQDALDIKLNDVFFGKVVRKDLLLQVKKGTNVPSFVLEFLLARYCASDDPREIQEGMAAVLETIQKNYVRPDESNKAQMIVQQRGKHTFIDKIHVKYFEKEKRPWARMENFNSSRIAINDRYYQSENDRIFEGGIWAECTVAHNDVEDDPYAFYIEKLKPIQLSRFDFDGFVEGRRQFTRDEWIDVLIRSFGIEPSWMSPRLKFHYLARLAPLVEANFNFIELGPRGNGKSYTFSEFSPYSTLLGAPTSAATLWWNNGRKQVGIIGFWDVVAFDEVGEGIVVRDRETFQVMKQYMANGNFTRSSSMVTASASLAFIGNIDDAIESVVNSPEHSLFKPLHPVFDLAILDRFHTFVPGWEIPKNKDENLTRNYGLIIEYLAEAFHHLARKTNRFAQVKAACKLGPGYDQRDQTAVLKTVCAFVKMLHPGDEPTQEEINEYLAYAIEGRRRVKEQLNKKKPDDEFANINLGFYAPDGQLITVFCPESRYADATQNPSRSRAQEEEDETVAAKPATVQPPPGAFPPPEAQPSALPEPVASEQTEALAANRSEPKERHYRIHYGAIGHSYESIFGDYLPGAEEIVIEDPYIRQNHQIGNFLRFCETAVRLGKPKRIVLITKFDNQFEKDEAMAKLFSIADSLKQLDISLEIKENAALHDREIRLSNGWTLKIGRGFDIYQKPDDWFQIGANDLFLRPCLETNVDVIPR